MGTKAILYGNNIVEQMNGFINQTIARSKEFTILSSSNLATQRVLKVCNKFTQVHKFEQVYNKFELVYMKFEQLLIAQTSHIVSDLTNLT